MVFFLQFTRHVIFKTSLIDAGNNPDKRPHHQSQRTHREYSWWKDKGMSWLRLLFLKEKLSDLQSTVRVLPQYLSEGMKPMLWQDRHQPSSLQEEKNSIVRMYHHLSILISHILFSLGFTKTKILTVNPLKIPQIKVLFNTILVL